MKELVVNPKVSIIVPTYNRAQYLSDALSSILKQSFDCFEIVVVDNASTDNTCEIVNEFADKRIRYFINERNIGATANHNKALRLCNGDYICIFSDDDLMDSDNLQLKVNVLDAYPDVCLVHSDCRLINSDGVEEGESYTNKLQEWNCYKTQNPLPQSVCFDLMTDNLFVVFPTMMVRASVLKENVIEFNNQLKYFIDWDLCLKLSLFGDFYYLNKKLISYRQHTTNESSALTRNICFIEQVIMRLSIYSLYKISSFNTSDVIRIYKTSLHKASWNPSFDKDNLSIRPFKDYIIELSSYKKMKSFFGK